VALRLPDLRYYNLACGVYVGWRYAYPTYDIETLPVGLVSAAPPGVKTAQKTKPGFPGLEHNS
jgi:hypothetical protein